jgi:hypothetical protein
VVGNFLYTEVVACRELPIRVLWEFLTNQQSRPLIGKQFPHRSGRQLPLYLRTNPNKAGVALSRRFPDRSARRQGGLELIISNSELNFPGIPPSFRAKFFIIHLRVLLHAVYRLIYIEINEINKLKNEMRRGTQKQRRRPNGGWESALGDQNTSPYYGRGRREGGEGAGGRGKEVWGRLRVGGRPTTMGAGNGRRAMGRRWEGSPDPERPQEMGELEREKVEGAGTHLRQQRPKGPQHGLLGQ